MFDLPSLQIRTPWFLHIPQPRSPELSPLFCLAVNKGVSFSGLSLSCIKVASGGTYLFFLGGHKVPPPFSHARHMSTVGDPSRTTIGRRWDEHDHDDRLIICTPDPRRRRRPLLIRTARQLTRFHSGVILVAACSSFHLIWLLPVPLNAQPALPRFLLLSFFVTLH